MILSMVNKKFKLKPNIGWKSLIIFGVAGILLAADLLTKYFEEAYGWNKVIIKGFIEIKSGIQNQGISFGMFDFNPAIGQPVIISLTCLMIVVVLFAFIFMPERFTLLKISTAMVFAGALGNLIDRCALLYVRDFFGLNLFGIMAYCNLADFWIVIGTVIAILDLLFLNEISVFPLTKKAKRVQAIKKADEEAAAQETDDSFDFEDGDLDNADDVVENGANINLLSDNEQSDGEQNDNR